MPLFIKQLPGLFNGVSQQPATLRLPSQAEEVINCSLSVVDGASKRPPTEHVAKLPDDLTDTNTAKLHVINRDTAHRFIVAITSGDIRVFDMEGNEKPVYFPTGKGTYLDSANPRRGFECVTIADFTFILNRDVVVEMDAAGADRVDQPTSYWWLNRSAGSGELAGAQQKQYATNPPVDSYRGEFPSIQRASEDDSGGPVGSYYKIQANADNKFASFYVRRKANAAFTECVQPPALGSIKNLIKATTMPHALVQGDDGEFYFGPFSWAPRHVGDESTNPNPTFVGRTIRDIFFRKNRLCFLADENLIASNVGDYGTFYRKTVTDTLADQVIDIAADGASVSVLNFAIPFNQGVMAFSDQTQFFVGSGNEGTTSTSMSIDTTTSYECSQAARPAPLGSDVYFASENGDSATIWEYFVTKDSLTNDASNVTAHCPTYVPANVAKLIASTNRDILFVLSQDQPSRLYPYKFYWQGDDKAQSAWSHWQFDTNDTILDGSVLGDYLYLCIERSSGVYIERLSLRNGAHPVGIPFEIFLDRRASVTGVYLDSEDKTEFTIPYVPYEGSLRIIKSAAFVDAEGSLIDPSTYEFMEPSFEELTTRRVKVLGNQTDGIVYVGQAYAQRYEFSEQFVTDSKGDAVNTGRLQIRSCTVYYVNTAYLRTEVDPYGDGSQTESVDVIVSRLAEFTGKTLGSTSLVVGDPTFGTGKYTFQVYAPATSAKIAIVNDSHLGCTIQKAEFELFYSNRAQVR